MKNKILDVIKDYKFDYSLFEHYLEDNPRTSAKHKFSFEGNGFLINIELEEFVVWSCNNEYELEHYEIYDLEILNDDMINHSYLFTDDEILNIINI